MQCYSELALCVNKQQDQTQFRTVHQLAVQWYHNGTVYGIYGITICSHSIRRNFTKLFDKKLCNFTYILHEHVLNNFQNLACTNSSQYFKFHDCTWIISGGAKKIWPGLASDTFFFPKDETAQSTRWACVQCSGMIIL